MNYLALLKLFLALGPKLPAVWLEVQKIIAAAQAIFGIVKPAVETGGTLEAIDLSPDEAEAEAAVAYILAGPNAAFDGAILRRVFAFAKANPWLMDALAALLKGG
jgi:hypothetical protein